MKAKRMLSLFLAGVLFLALTAPGVRAYASEIEPPEPDNPSDPPSQTFTVTYQDGVEDEVIFDDAVTTVNEGDPTPAFETTPVREGYVFTGWDPELKDVVTEDTVYTAKWAKTYTVTYRDGIEGAELFPDKVFPVTEGEKVPAYDAPARSGYVFASWNGKYKPGEQTAIAVTSDLEFVAQWVEAPAVPDNGFLQENVEIQLKDEFRSDVSFSTSPVTTFQAGTPTWNAKAQKYVVDFTASDLGSYESRMNDLVQTQDYRYQLKSDSALTVRFTSALIYKPNEADPSKMDASFEGWKLEGKGTPELLFHRAYTVTYKDGAEGKIFADQVKATVETAIDSAPVPDFDGTPTRAGFTFAGWDPSVPKTVSGNMVFTAQWTPNPTLTFTLDSNGGKELKPITVVASDGSGNLNGGDLLRVLPEPGTVAGLNSLGWYLADENGDPVGQAIQENTEIQADANFALIQMREIATPEIGIQTARGITYTYNGKAITLTAGCTEHPGLVYAYQWSKNGTGLEGQTKKTLELKGEVADTGKYSVTVTVTKGDALSAVKTTNDSAQAAAETELTVAPAENRIIYDPNDGNGGPLTDSSLEQDGDDYVAKIKDGEPTRDGYTFTGWNTQKDGKGDKYGKGSTYRFGKVSDRPNGGYEATLYAQWSANSYTITFDANGGKTDTGSKTVTYGQPVGTLPTATRSNYIFDGWFNAAGNEVTEETVYNAAGNKTLTARWTGKTFTVTLDPDGGKVSSKTVKVNYGDPLNKLPTPTKKGYTFRGWYTSSGKKVTKDTLMTGNITLTAKWTLPSDNPKTGDSLSAIPAIIIMTASLAGAAYLTYRKKRS